MIRRGDGCLCSMLHALRTTRLRLSVQIRYRSLQTVQKGSAQAQSKICIRYRDMLVVPSEWRKGYWDCSCGTAFGNDLRCLVKSGYMLVRSKEIKMASNQWSRKSPTTTYKSEGSQIRVLTQHVHSMLH